jgi:hypothetical protein
MSVTPTRLPPVDLAWADGRPMIELAKSIPHRRKNNEDSAGHNHAPIAPGPPSVLPDGFATELEGTSGMPLSDPIRARPHTLSSVDLSPFPARRVDRRIA